MIDSAIKEIGITIEMLNVGQAGSAQMKLKGLRDELIESNKRAHQQSRKLSEENARKIKSLEEENEINLDRTTF